MLTTAGLFSTFQRNLRNSRSKNLAKAAALVRYDLKEEYCYNSKRRLDLTSMNEDEENEPDSK